MKRRHAPVLPLLAPKRVRQAWATVGVAYRKYSAYVEETCRALNAPDGRQQYESAPDLPDAVGVGQEGMCIYGRWQASYHAWLRKQPWATEDRLEADAKMFAEYVARECRPLARVVELRR